MPGERSDGCIHSHRRLADGRRTALYGQSMRRSWPAPVLLAGGLVLLVSLYLPWRKSPCALPESGGSRSIGSLLDTMTASCQTHSAWSSGVAPAAALASLVLVAVAAVVWIRPRLRPRVPLMLCGLAAGYFLLAVDAMLRRYVHELEGG